MLENISKYKVVLASNSPRRKELLAGLDIDFEVKTLPDIDESYPDTLWKEEIPVYIAKLKAEAYRNYLQPDTLLITADTIVWLEGKVYGKPQDEENAENMLRILSGQTHEVITGVCVTSMYKQEAFHALSKVRFAKLEEAEIGYYVKKYKPCDKAGAYGVQEWIGYIGVEELNGSFYNVMGLPVKMLYTCLKKWDL
ncbi:MAG: Maf-like protein [Dysgonamonadaceae bacterium]|jgi:septum formation protein|nr:Maf-like protein [Dysgonamonadaceae bacterium]